MSQIIILGEFDVHPDDASTAADLMRTMMIETVKERGCAHYAFSRDLTASNRFQLSELWESAEVLDAHFQTSHMAAFRAGMAKLRVEKRRVDRYKAEAAGAL